MTFLARVSLVKREMLCFLNVSDVVFLHFHLPMFVWYVVYNNIWHVQVVALLMSAVLHRGSVINPPSV